MSNTQTPEAAGYSGLLFHTPAPQPAPPPVPAPLERSVDCNCGRCRRPVPVTVTTTHRVEERKGKRLIRGRHNAPARATCPQCETTFRVHLIEQPDGQVVVALGLRIA